MSQPTEYTRQANFTDHSTATPTVPHSGVDLDAEFDAVKNSLDETQTNLALIQKDDGQLANRSVGADQLKTEITFGLNAVTPWATATAYEANAGVWHSRKLYRCLVAHTSGTFDTDLAALDWELLLDLDTYLTTAEGAASSAEADAALAAASQTAAATSETNAGVSETNAAASAAAALVAAAGTLWQDVVFLTFADSPHTVTDSDSGKLFVCDCTGGDVELDLPQISTLSLIAPWAIGAKKSDGSGNSVQITAGGTDTIDGAGTGRTISVADGGYTLIPDTDTSPDTWTTAAFGAVAGTITVDDFDGDGSTVAFTLSNAPGSKNNTAIYIDGVYQAKSTYEVSGVTLTFDAAPAAGTANIEAVSGSFLAAGSPADGSVTTAKLANLAVTTAKIALLAVTTALINDLAVTTGKLDDLSVTSAKLALLAVATGNIQASAVTLAKMEDRTASTLLGRGDASAGVPQEITLGTGLAMTGTVLSATAQTPSAASVGQSQLKTTQGTGSSTSASALLTLPGGEYGFYPQLRAVVSAGTVSVTLINSRSTPASLTSVIDVEGHDQVGGSGDPYDGTLSYAQRYITASPPYDYGEGDMDAFVFAEVQKGTGKVVSTWIAMDPPWAYNGPTPTKADAYRGKKTGKIYLSVFDALAAQEAVEPVRARHKTSMSRKQAIKQGGASLVAYMEELQTADIEYVPVTMAQKMKDMGVVPHPFPASDPMFCDVVMIDPQSPIARQLLAFSKEDDDGMSVAELLHSRNIKIDNENLKKTRNRKGPDGVMIVRARFR